MAHLVIEQYGLLIDDARIAQRLVKLPLKLGVLALVEEVPDINGGRVHAKLGTRAQLEAVHRFLQAVQNVQKAAGATHVKLCAVTFATSLHKVQLRC